MKIKLIKWLGGVFGTIFLIGGVIYHDVGGLVFGSSLYILISIWICTDEIIKKNDNRRKK